MSIRKALESQYKGLCTITVREETIDPTTKRVKFVEATPVVDQPCKLSYSTISSAGNDVVAEVVQSIKLFLAPEINVPAGSKVTVTQNEKTAEFQRSGEPATYSNHQEIRLELFKGWA